MQRTLDFPRIDLQELSLWLIPADLTVSTSTKSTLHNYVTNKVQYEIDGLSCQDQHQLRKTATDICTIFVSCFAFGDMITDVLQRLPPACGKTNWLWFQPVGKSSNQQREY